MSHPRTGNRAMEEAENLLDPRFQAQQETETDRETNKKIGSVTRAITRAKMNKAAHP